MVMRKLWLTIVALVGTSLWWADTVQAAGPSVQSEIGFSVAAKQASNQINHHVSFFDLKMAPGQRETLQTTIYNTTDHEITVEHAVHTAYTNPSGELEYITPAKKYDPSLKYRLDQLTHIDGEHKVTVPAHGERVVSATLTMPGSDFHGTLLGGWYFKRINDKVTGEVKGATNIKNEYSYNIAIMCQLGENPAPQMKLGTVHAGLFHYHQGIIVNLRNVTAVLIPALKLKTVISNRDTGTIVKSASQKRVYMAPNSGYQDSLLLRSQPLRAGRYHLKLDATNHDHHWHFERDFTITDDDAHKFNQKSVDIKPDKTWLFMLLSSLATLLLVVIIWGVWLWWHRRKERRTMQVGEKNE
ncbi:DUF916 and DUF3324 domain-containing protein [Lactiplantibacillus garii]|uniref:DUF916 and DUF3324 domain-containing protein n=1 Tax=Lactiplantibacillus garii TaxID=2306423 RepID=A0A3R8J7Z7_9LACO|nr:DUF916 and DUF3324 domain-containing protein [Lactiplantibacillus garii]RRK10577.1 DUF916 and DUF3324 domain-containing protein [Lactiplantibacillus garii]